MGKALKILKWLTGEDADRLEKVREVLAETVGKAVRDELGKVIAGGGLGKVIDVIAPKGGTTAETPKAEAGEPVTDEAPAAGKVTFKDLLVAVDKDKLKAFLAGLDKEKVKAYIDAADKGMLKLLVDSADVDALIRYVDELEGGGTQKQATPAPAPEMSDLEGAPELSWCYGGFDGSKTKIVEDAVLRDATLKGDTLSFSWDKGGCEQLGAPDAEDASVTMACLFLASGKGGKFEWISTSRKTRDMKNIKEGYNGWPKDALADGGRLFFCIASTIGLRTAVVEVSRS